MTELVVQQSSATAAYRRVYLHLVDATDGITPETGIAAATAMLSVNGAAAAASTNNIVEIDAGDLPGAYYLELTAAELGTLGTIRGGFKAAACAWAPFTVKVVAYDPHAAGPTAADIADAVWDEDLSGHAGAGTAGKLVSDTESAVDTEVAALVTAVDAVPTAAESAAGLLDLANGVETGLTLRQALRGIAAVLLGKKSGSGTASEVFRNAVADSADRVTVVADADGDRTAVTLNL
jgi:hypothetical protein